MAKLINSIIDTTANTESNIVLDKKGTKFLVKNMTDDYINVTLDETYDSENRTKIPSETAQIITTNICTSLAEATDCISIMPLTDSVEGVEIQCLD